ncbi:hypothetical protein D3C87_1367380 [compost metagenome]
MRIVAMPIERNGLSLGKGGGQFSTMRRAEKGVFETGEAQYRFFYSGRAVMQVCIRKALNDAMPDGSRHVGGILFHFRQKIIVDWLTARIPAAQKAAIGSDRVPKCENISGQLAFRAKIRLKRCRDEGKSPDRVASPGGKFDSGHRTHGVAEQKQP